MYGLSNGMIAVTFVDWGWRSLLLF